MALCFALAVYNHVKKIIIIMCECTSVLGQKTSAAHRRVECFIVFWLSGKYTQDLKFVHVYFFYSYQKKVFLSLIYRNRLMRPLTYKFTKMKHVKRLTEIY